MEAKHEIAVVLTSTDAKSESYRTVDEIRAEEGLPPLPDGAGEVILNPTWLQTGAGDEEDGDGSEA